MTKKTNAFMDLDMFKVWTDFDASKAAGQFTKMMADMNLPQIDVESVLASQRKNAEALAAANEKVLEGVKSVAERQAGIMREVMENSSSILDTLGKAKSPQEAVEQQIELARTTYEKAAKDMSELSDMVSKTNTAAAAPVTARIKEGFAEAKAMASSTAK